MSKPGKTSIFLAEEMTGAGSPRKLEKKMVAIYAIFLLLPMFAFQLVFFLNMHGMHYFKIIPVWNDEVWWWSQVDGMIKYGAPLGYMGYNGTHAAVGTFGPWGVAPLLPYMLIGKIFGWELHSMAYANVMLLSIAGFVFCLLAKPDKKQIKWVFGLYLTSYITITYSFTAMAEGHRYAVAIILTGIALWLREHSKDVRKLDWKTITAYVLSLCFLFYAINVYLIFALMVPVFVWYILKGVKPSVRIVIAVIATFVLSIAAYQLTGIYTAPYTTSTIETLLDVLHEQGVYAALCTFLSVLFDNLKTVGLFYLVYSEAEYLQWYFLTYMVLFTVLLVMFIKKCAAEKQSGKGVKLTVLLNGNTFFALYLLAGFLIGYCALYTGSATTLCRGTNTGFLMVLFLFAMGDWDKDAEVKRFMTMRYIVLLFFFLGLSAIWRYHTMIISERIDKIPKRDVILAEKKKLEEVIEISPSKSTWENTVAEYGSLDSLYMALPSGAGSNYMIDNGVNEDAGYAVYLSIAGEDEKKEWAEMLEKNDHELIFEDDYFTVYKNNKVQE